MEDFLSINAAAELIGVSYATVRRAVYDTKVLPMYKARGRLWVKRSELMAWNTPVPVAVGG